METDRFPATSTSAGHAIGVATSLADEYLSHLSAVLLLEGGEMPHATSRPTIRVPGTTSHTIAPREGQHSHEGTLRYLKAGTGAPVVLLHTVRTQAEHFRYLVPAIADRFTVYALDLPGMGYSEIVPGASYQ